MVPGARNARGAPVSASPRKLLRRALDALDQVDEVLRRYPEARADLERRLGPDLFARTVGARETLAEAAAALDVDPAATPRPAPDGGP